MTWYNKTDMICTGCQKEYITDINTLTLSSKEYKNCPHCKSSTGEVVKTPRKEKLVIGFPTFGSGYDYSDLM
jgi:Zn finger protein HypA/HybF involved in hydrogenase expression